MKFKGLIVKDNEFLDILHIRYKKYKGAKAKVYYSEKENIWDDNWDFYDKDYYWIEYQLYTDIFV